MEEIKYIFESPDRGKTIFKRKSGESCRELVKKQPILHYISENNGKNIKCMISGELCTNRISKTMWYQSYDDGKTLHLCN